MPPDRRTARHSAGKRQSVACRKKPTVWAQPRTAAAVCPRRFWGGFR